MEDDLDRGLLDGLLGYQLRRAQQRVFGHFARTFADLDVTPGQVGLLVLIARNPGVSQTRLARATGVERSTLGEAVERLAARGWVTREAAPRDRRSYALALTDAGHDFLAALEPRLQAHEAEVASRLRAHEREQLLELLVRLNE